MESTISTAALLILLTANPAERVDPDNLETRIQANARHSQVYAAKSVLDPKVHEYLAKARNTPKPVRVRDLDLGVDASRSFNVLAPIGDHLAARVLKKSEALRKSVALEWLGEVQPAGAEFTIIHIAISESDADKARLLLAGKNHGRQYPGKNRLWITTTRDRAVGSTLAHEITHIVMAIRFPLGMPVWANEGIASLQDDDQRATKRFRLMKKIATSGQWPSLHVLMNLKSMAPDDAKNYALAESLVSYMLTLGSKQKFIQFIDDSMATGWNRALQKHYRIAGINVLQSAWQNWVRQQVN